VHWVASWLLRIVPVILVDHGSPSPHVTAVRDALALRLSDSLTVCVVAACCSILHCAAVCGNAMQRVVAHDRCAWCVCVALVGLPHGLSCCSMLQHVAACCSVLQCEAICCSVYHTLQTCVMRLRWARATPSQSSTGSVLQCIAVWCIVSQCMSIHTHIHIKTYKYIHSYFCAYTRRITYGVTTISKLLQIIRLFCRISSLL